MISPLNLAQLYISIEEIWSLIKKARVYEACAASRKLVQDIEDRLVHKHTDFLCALADACFACGYATSMNSRNTQTTTTLYYFKRMEEVARAIDDPSRLIIALTYQGDTYRRRGDLEKAKTHLQAAYDISSPGDMAAHGNCAQLLGRVYLRMSDLATVQRLQAEAEAIAAAISPANNSTHGQYCLGTVYIDYARTHSQQRRIQKAIDALQRAEQVLPPNQHWEALLMVTRADILLRDGDLNEGLPLTIQLIELSHKRGNMRLLERIYDLQRFLTERAIEESKAASSLNEALHGPFEG